MHCLGTTSTALWCLAIITRLAHNGAHTNASSSTSTTTATKPQHLTQAIALQLKHVSKQHSKQLLKENVADQDPTHAKFFLKSSVEWFLSSMLSKLSNNDDQQPIKLYQLQIYKVTIHSQMIGKPSSANNKNSSDNKTNSGIQVQPRSGTSYSISDSEGDRRLGHKKSQPQDVISGLFDEEKKADLSSTHETYRQLQSNGNSEVDDVLVPLYVNITVDGTFKPVDDKTMTQLTQHEYEELLLFLFNNKSRDLVEKLLDLSSVNVPYFQHLTQIRAVSGSGSGSSTSSISKSSPKNSSSSKTSSTTSTTKWILAIIAACLSATGVIILSVIIFRKVCKHRRRKTGRDARKRYSKVSTEPNQDYWTTKQELAPPPPPYYSSSGGSGFQVYSGFSSPPPPPPQPFSDTYSFSPSPDLNQVQASEPLPLPPPPSRPFIEAKSQLPQRHVSTGKDNVNSSRLPSDIPRDIIGGPAPPAELQKITF